MVVIAVIELGEIAAGQVVYEPATRPWPQRRLAAVTVALGFALITLGGGAPAARPLPMAVLNAAVDSTILATADRVVVVDRGPLGRGRGRDPHVTAYRLMDLERLWQVEVPLNTAAVSSLVSGDTVVLSRLDYATPLASRSGSPPETVALDAASGHLLWRQEGSAETWTSSGHLVMSLHAGVPVAAGEPDGDGELLRVLSARTGAVVWSVDVPPGAIRTYRSEDGRLTLLALIRTDGRIELRDADTGAVLRSARVAPPSPSTSSAPSTEIVGDLLLIREQTAVAAYGLDTLELRWRLPAPAGGTGWASSCGDALCFVDDQTGLRSVDPRTGRVRWSGRWTNVLTAAAGGLLVGDYDSRTGGLRVVAIDPGTGQVRQDLGTWDGIDRNVRDEWVIGYQFDLTRALVSRVEPGRGARILGVLTDVSRSCRVREPMLLCRRTDNTVGVWRLPG